MANMHTQPPASTTTVAQAPDLSLRGGGPRGIVVTKAKPKDAWQTLGRIWHYLSVYRTGLFGVLLSTVLVTACSLAAPYLLGIAVDHYIIPGDYAGLVRIGGILLGIYALHSLTSWLQQFIMVKVSMHTVREMRRDIFQRLQLLPLRFFDSKTHGELMSRSTNDIENVSGTLNQSVTQLIASVLALVGSVAVMLYLNVWLTLVSMVMIPFVVFATKLVAQWTRRYFSEQQKKLGELNSFIEETISGQKVVQVYRREQVAISRFGRMNEQLTGASIRAQIYSGVVAPLMNMLNNISFALMAAVGGWMAFQDWTTVGIVVAFLNYSKQFQRPLNDLANQFNLVQSAIAGAERVFETIDTETEYEQKAAGDAEIRTNETDREDNARNAKSDDHPITEGLGRQRAEGEHVEGSIISGRSHLHMEGDPHDAPRSKDDALESMRHGTECDDQVSDQVRGEVLFEDVSFSYQAGVPILQHVSLSASPGQMIALVGPTGAGKTTIINLLTRFYEVDTGKITIDGVDIREMDKDTLRGHIGLVLQDAYLFSDTIRENIRYGRLDASEGEIEAAAKLANAHSFIQKLPQGYDTLLAPGGQNLSQGQRQLVTIARAVLANPAILILDEATSSIDTRTEMHIQTAMRELMRGRTSFVIAHRLGTIREADQILVMNNGTIIERGTHAQLLEQQGQYYALYNSQFRRIER